MIAKIFAGELVGRVWEQQPKPASIALGRERVRLALAGMVADPSQ